VENGKCPILS